MALFCYKMLNEWPCMTAQEKNNSGSNSDNDFVTTFEILNNS